MDILSLIVCAGIGLAIVYITSRLLASSKNAGRPPLPPGPKGLPLVGNLNDLPAPGVFEAKHWLQHKELYGSSHAPLLDDPTGSQLIYDVPCRQ